MPVVTRYGLSVRISWYDRFSDAQQEKLYRSLARIYIQLRRLVFPSIGRLQHDPAGLKVSKMVMSMDINMQAMEGLDPYVIQDSSYDDRNTLTSACAYPYILLDLADSAFAKSRSSRTEDEYLGADMLYQLYIFRKYVEAWLNPSLDKGLFVLVWGDLGLYNLLVNEEMEITFVLDWEWSHAVPQQFFLPPLWLTRHRPPELAFPWIYDRYLKSFDRFLSIMGPLEREMYGNELLSDEWEIVKSDAGFLVANALENWTDIDYFAARYLRKIWYKKEELERRIWEFVNEDPARETFIKKKLEDGLAYMKELKEMQK